MIIKILHFWKDKNEKALMKEKEELKKVWNSIDGFPYTTSSIHINIAWKEILKHLIKCKLMRVFKTTDTFNNLTYYLPIEAQMEKEFEPINLV